MEGIVQMQTTAPEAAASFEAAMGEFYPGLVRRLTAVLHDPEGANDIAQEAYLRAYRSWDRFDGTDARAWLFTIGLRLAFNERRRRRRWNAWGDRDAPGTIASWLSRAKAHLREKLTDA